MIKLKHILSGLLLLSLLAGSIVAQASPRSQGQVILLIVDNVNYDDFQRYGGANLRKVLEQGALGLMNTNSGGDYEDCGSYATLGAGNYAVCSPGGMYVKEQPKSASDGAATVPGSLVNRDLDNLVAVNEPLNRSVKVGLLGELLNHHGLKTAVIGSESSSLAAAALVARAALITMNRQGRTDYGRVDGSLLQPDPKQPSGLSTDYEALWAAYQEVEAQANFIVIQTGDTHRLDKSEQVSKEEAKQAKALIFKNMDVFLGRVLESLDQDSLLMVAVPFPSREDIAAGKKLTPVVAYGPSVSGGVLSSATTKRDGLITNTDLAAEVAHFFNLKPDLALIGHRLVYKRYQEPLPQLEQIERQAVFNYRHRAQIISAFVCLVVVLLVLYGVAASSCPHNLVYLKPLLLAGMILPTVLLVLPLFKPWNITAFAGIALLLTVGVGWAAIFTQDTIKTVCISLLLSAALIVGDTVAGNPLMKASILGYDPIVGARFYGIGNEYMGFLLGATLMGTAALLEKYRLDRQPARLVSMVILITVFLTLALPSLGTNVGGAMAAFFGFGTFLVLVFKGRITKKDLAWLGLGLVVFLFFLFMADGRRSPEKQSHIGQFSSLMRQQGISAWLQVAKRKLMMNYRLIKYSIWTRMLVAMAVVLTAVFRWPVRLIEPIQDRYAYLYYAVVAGMVSTVAALIFNDSGVVAAATCILPVGITVLIAADIRL